MPRYETNLSLQGVPVQVETNTTLICGNQILFKVSDADGNAAGSSLQTFSWLGHKDYVHVGVAMTAQERNHAPNKITTLVCGIDTAEYIAAMENQSLNLGKQIE